MKYLNTLSVVMWVLVVWLVFLIKSNVGLFLKGGIRSLEFLKQRKISFIIRSFIQSKKLREFSFSRMMGASTEPSRSKRGKYPRVELWRSLTEEIPSGISADSLPKRQIQDVLNVYGVTSTSVDRMLQDFPALGRFEIQTRILPMVRFLYFTLCGRESDTINEIANYPHYFSYDLERLIAVRHAFLCKLSTRNPHIPIQKSLLTNNCKGLRNLIESSDDEFVAYINNKTRNYGEYEAVLKSDYFDFRSKFYQGILFRCKHVVSTIV